MLVSTLIPNSNTLKVNILFIQFFYFYVIKVFVRPMSNKSGSYVNKSMKCACARQRVRVRVPARACACASACVRVPVRACVGACGFAFASSYKVRSQYLL